MKNHSLILSKLLVIALFILFLLPAGAQVYLIDVLKPVEQQGCSIEGINGNTATIGSHKYPKYFYLRGPEGGLIGSGKPGVAVYQLGGKYSKLTFWLGAANANPSGDDGDVIVTITGDGKRLLDTPIFDHSAPRWVELDVTGINEIRFTALKGSESAGFGLVQLWKAGQQPVRQKTPVEKLPAGRIQLVKDLEPYFQRHNGFSYIITSRERVTLDPHELIKEISINRKTFTSGLQFSVSEGFSEEQVWSYFWLGKRYDKLSFILGPRDNQSSKSSAWVTIKADKKTVWEGIVRQDDLAQQVVVDVAGAEVVSFNVERRSSDFLGGMTFGVVDIFAYPAGYANLPQAGTVSVSNDQLAGLPDVCPLMSSIKPYSVRGMSKADKTLFYGESRYYTFSMGGVKYYEGMLLTTGNTLMNDQIDSYALFNLGGEFDYISFDAGCLSKNHVLDDDNLRIYADEELIFDQRVYCTWPNQHHVLKINKCHKLRFEKKGNGKQKQTIIGVADILLYRGEPVDTLIFEHVEPDFPYEVDLIDLCGKPYFHYNGRYCSTLTGFSMDDCFHDGSTIREYFQMKDGSQINKGFMLETNIPLALENVTVMDAICLLLTGVGANISHSDVSAATGTTAGASGTMAGGIFLLLNDPSNKQAAACAFNPYGQYETCTFKVANKSEHMDEFAETFGDRSEAAVRNPVKLNVMADQVLVGEYWLDNKMQPMEITVPIFKCHQLMFWMECGDTRSGQYVFYDLKLSKEPCNLPIPKKYTSTQNNTPEKMEKTQPTQSEERAEADNKEERKQKVRKAFGIGLGILDALIK